MAEGDYQIGVYQRTTGKYVVFDNTNQSNRVTKREYDRRENVPASLVFCVDNNTPTAVNNILNTSYAGWSASGTGAISMGDYVEYKLWATGDTQLRRVMYGVIIDLRGLDNGDVQITVKDFAQVLEGPRPYKTVFGGYRDGVFRETTVADGTLSFGLADAAPVMPLASVKYAHTDYEWTPYTPTDSTDAEIWDSGSQTSMPAAQPFISEGDGLIAVRVEYYTAGGHSTDTKVSVYADIDGEPGGELIASATNTTTFSAGNTAIDYVFVSSGAPILIYPGRKYWLVIEVTNTPSAALEIIGLEPSGDILTTYLHKTDGTNWATIATSTLKVNVVYTIYDDVSNDELVYVTYDEIYITNASDITAIAGYTYTLYRVKASYFYGTVTHQDICKALVEHNTNLRHDTLSAQARTFGTFSTMGQSLAQSLRTLMDVFETSGDWSGYQHVYAHYLSGDAYTGNNYLKISKRLKTSNDSSRTFSYYADTSTDNEVRIMGKPDLRKSTTLKPCSVTVIGKDGAGHPLPCTRHDRALSGSLGATVAGFTEHKTFYDETLRTLADVDRVAWAYLDSYKTNVWEGRITVSGTFPDLFDMTTASASYGSGLIITLNYSPLGISAEKFKVLGVTCIGNTTTIQISNRDTIYDNRLNTTINRTDIGESFQAPVGLVDDLFVSIYDPTAIAATSGYMTLLDSAGNPITGLERAECTVFTNTDYNLKTFHAVFEKWMGYSSTAVNEIALFTAKTAGSEIEDYLLVAAGPPIRDERFYKWKSMRVHIDYTCKAA